MSTCVLVVIYIYIYSFVYIICIRNSSVINLYSTLHLTAIEIQYLIAIEMQ